MKLDNRQSPWRKIIDRWIGIPLVVLAALFRRLFFFWPESPGPRSHPGKKPRILLIKLSALGDAVLLLPSLYRLKNEFGNDVEIVFLGGSSNEGFLKLCRAIDEVRVFSAASARSLVGERFDLVIDYDQWVRATALLAAATRGAITCGFRSGGQYRHYAYDVKTTLDLQVHMARNFWNLTVNAVAKWRTKTTQGRPTESVPADFTSDRDGARAQWRSAFLGPLLERELPAKLPAKFAVIHPGCGEHGIFREWPIENWQTVVAVLGEKGIPTVVTGKGPHEKHLADKLVESGATSVVDRCDFGQIMALLARSSVVLVPNTGIMHLADFINDSVVVLEGPTNPKVWGPLWKGREKVSRLACAPCLTWGHDYGCSDPVCMKVLTPQDILEELPC